jgi:hypothetical protein
MKRIKFTSSFRNMISTTLLKQPLNIFKILNKEIQIASNSLFSNK